MTPSGGYTCLDLKGANLAVGSNVILISRPLVLQIIGLSPKNTNDNLKGTDQCQGIIHKSVRLINFKVDGVDQNSQNMEMTFVIQDGIMQYVLLKSLTGKCKEIQVVIESVNIIDSASSKLSRVILTLVN